VQYGTANKETETSLGVQMIFLDVNDERVVVDTPETTPLLWVLRDYLGLTGTKYGCGVAMCGACTVHIDGESQRACVTPIGDVQGKKITTIEGLDRRGDHPLQKAWIAEQVPQCGYCQSGQLMQAAALLLEVKAPTREQIVQHMDGNLCRCGTYNRIVRAIERVVKEGGL
jgi:isoquinoline 1-oxidoreductase alpha subunit